MESTATGKIRQACRVEEKYQSHCRKGEWGVRGRGEHRPETHSEPPRAWPNTGSPSYRHPARRMNRIAQLVLHTSTILILRYQEKKGGLLICKRNHNRKSISVDILKGSSVPGLHNITNKKSCYIVRWKRMRQREWAKQGKIQYKLSSLRNVCLHTLSLLTEQSLKHAYIKKW